MKKKLKIKKGSSLVVVLLVFSILTILGTSMLSLTLMSYKKRSAEVKIKSNLYMSESGLAEAYSIVGKYVDKAFEEGSETAENELAILLDKEKLKLADDKSSEYIYEDGTINEEKVKEYQEGIFRKAYKHYMGVNLNALKGKLEEEENYTASNVNSVLNIKPKIVVMSESSTVFNARNELNLVLQSTFDLDNFKKTIQATYVIKVPQYSNVSNSPNKIIRLTKNPVWAKAICADGDMKIQSGTININGDIYIKGKEADTANRDVGIILSNKYSKLMVKGDVATSKNLEATYNANLSANEGSEIEVQGNIYAKNVIVARKPSEAYGAKGTKVITESLTGTTSDGSVYVMDDMEVNAENSSVDIRGGFYGVSDGSQATNNTPDNSSSIIVNAEDIGKNNGSTINIDKEVYIAGSAYVSGLKYGTIEDYKYQTGESVSIKGNYRAYTQPLIDDYNIVKTGENTNLKDDMKFEYFEPLALASKYRYFKEDEVSVFIENANIGTEIHTTSLGVYFSAIGKTNNPAAKNYSICYDIPNNIWSEVTPLDLSLEIPMVIASKTEMKLKLLDQNNNILGTVKNISVLDYKELSVFDKSEYFKAYYTDYNSNSELNLGRGITIGNMSKSIYFASIFSGSSTDNPILISNYNTDAELKINTKRNELKDQLFYMGYSEDENYKNSNDMLPSIDMDIVTTPQITVNGQVNFNANVFNDTTKNRQGITGNNVDASREIILLNGYGNKSYAFIEEGGSEIGIPNADIEKIYYKSSTSGTTFNCIIVTKGDLYLSGNINFTGTIICGGTIYFTDNTEKSFTYDEAYIKNHMSNNYSTFKNIFKNPLSSKNDIYVDVFEGERSFVKSSMLQMRDWVIIK